MIVGLGMDIVGVLRIAESISRFGDRFLQRVFTPAEIAYCRTQKHPVPHYAARFAAKEAALKALGTGLAAGASWQHVEIRRASSGKPTIHLTGQTRNAADALGITHLHVTLSHTNTHASAVVILEKLSPQVP